MALTLALVVHHEGLTARFGGFSLIGLVTVPVTLVVGVLRLWAGIRLVGR